MFGLNAWLAKQHLVSHLIVAAGKWLLEKNNPIMSHVSPEYQSELESELQTVVDEREKVLHPATNSGSQPVK